MDKKSVESDENELLLQRDTEADEIRTCRSNSGSSGSGSVDTFIFDSRMKKTSTQVGDLAATWGGPRSLPESGSSRLRRARSWSGIAPDNSSAEVRILRERLVRTQTRLRPGALRRLSRRQKLTLVSLAVVDFMSFCSMSIMAPFFPREAQDKGLSNSMCGLVFSFYAIVMFITSPLFGKFLPVIGAKFLFSSGMFIAGACNCLFGTLVYVEDTTMFTSLCFLVRGLEALGASAYSTASYVFVVNAFPDSIGSVLGILETFVGLGMSVGPAIGGALYSIGGFGLPFYSLGIVMVLTVPINHCLLTDCEEYVSGSKTASILKLFQIPSIITIGLVIVIVSNTWAFLDPTLEPHLRQFRLSTQQIGLVFLLFSSLYGIFSPIWGWVADRVHNHWCMMVWGLFLSSFGLILLGPCPFIPGLPRALWLDLVALSILGMSVALTLLPTFQGVLTSSIYEGGCPEALATYSAVAGVWSCCYSLGEVLGPALGGALSELYGFPLCATLFSAGCFTMAVVTLTFFTIRESAKWSQSDTASESIPYTDSTWNSGFCRTHSAPEGRRERSPLLTPCSCSSHNGYYATGSSNLSTKKLCLKHGKSKSGWASVTESIAYFLKFQYVTDMYIRIRRSQNKRKCYSNANEILYQNYLENEDKNKKAKFRSISECLNINNNSVIPKKRTPSDSYVLYLENTIFGSPDVLQNINMDNLRIKRNNSGLVEKYYCYDEDEKNATTDILRHNLEKVQFYENNPTCNTGEDIFNVCECRDSVTNFKDTVTLSSAGACEV